MYSITVGSEFALPRWTPIGLHRGSATPCQRWRCWTCARGSASRSANDNLPAQLEPTADFYRAVPKPLQSQPPYGDFRTKLLHRLTLIGAYHHAVAEVVKSFKGFVARHMGDGILIYFGYPRAHEDDAERGANREAVSLLDEALQIVERTGDAMVRSGVEQA
jgi:hypothetical protein